jgi:hypothetical protein
METNPRFRLTGHVIIGLLIIACGVAFLLDNLGIIDAGNFFKFWPALVVLYGVARAIECPLGQMRVIWLGIALVGFFLLLDRMHLIYFRLHEWWPLILIVIGIGMLVTSMRRRPFAGASPSDSAGKDPSSEIHLAAVMGGFKRRIESQNFRGGSLTAVLGGCDLDMRRAEIEGEEAVLEVFAFWGGIDLKVPETWTIVPQAMPIMGGIDDKTTPPRDGKGKRLIINGMLIMGGMQISNRPAND